MDAEALFQKFTGSKQESLRLSIALEGFLRDSDGDRREVYGQYLCRRLQPAASALIEAGDTAGLARLAEQGWFTEKQTDASIALARKKRKTAALVWLLRFKGEAYGYRDRDFSL